jgi:hypothetical protein
MSEPFHREPKFREDSGINYPPFCTTYFEKYFYEYITKAYQEGNIDKKIYEKYIPVFWNEVQINKRYDDTLVTMVRTEENNYIWVLWDLLFNLPKDTQYFTVVQHDDGITISSKPSNLITFGMGGMGNIPIPLTYNETLIFNDEKYINMHKSELCSFVGSLTHPCREKMVNILKYKPGVTIFTNDWTNQIQDNKQLLYLKIMSKSRFTLAPRGYGKTSFRLYEALRMGSVPVYIYDDMWLPYQEIIDWSKMVVLVHVDELDKLYDRLKCMSDDEVNSMKAYYKKVEYLFTYDGICDYIINKMSNKST